MSFGKLYICGTPIGNMEDVTLRLLRVLGEADIIAAEDTRHTRKLLSRHSVGAGRHEGAGRRPGVRLVSYNQHNEASRGEELISAMKGGKTVALVSDAGMPGISDPGHRLIKRCIENEIPLEVVPGPSAFVSALVVSGLPTERFLFLGFPPRKKKERADLLEGIAGEEATLIFYEAPRRLVSFLESLRDVLKERRVAVVREITKIHEEVARGTAAEVAERMASAEVKGEIVVVVEGSGVAGGEAAGAHDEIAGARRLAAEALLSQLLKSGMSRRDAAKTVAREFKLKTRDVYDWAIRRPD